MNPWAWDHWHSFWSDFLIRNNAVWNIMMVDKEFCKSMDGSFDTSIVCREGISISRISVYCSKHKVLLLPWGKQSNVINLRPHSWLITLRNGVILGTQCRSLLLSGWAHSHGYIYVGFAEWKPWYWSHAQHLSLLLWPNFTSNQLWWGSPRPSSAQWFARKSHKT